MDKEVYSYFDLAMLNKLTSVQNNGSSAKDNAQICLSLLTPHFLLFIT